MTGPAASALEDFYAAKDESRRLGCGAGCVERLRTQELLRATLPPPPVRILDIGGADGAHAAWLQQEGYDVEIVDVIPAHVDRARARGLAAHQGDARSLAYDEDSADVVLLLGPLYHLGDRADRVQALREARRVLRPRGLLAAAAVSRLAVALDWLHKGKRIDAEARATIERIVACGHDEAGGGIFYFHTAAELGREIAEAGFDVTAVRGIEGPAWPLLDPRCPPEDPLVAQVADVARLADRDGATVAASAHLLALARA